MKELYKINGIRYYQDSGTSVDDMMIKDENGNEWSWIDFYENIYNK